MEIALSTFLHVINEGKLGSFGMSLRKLMVTYIQKCTSPKLRWRNSDSVNGQSLFCEQVFANTSVKIFRARRPVVKNLPRGWRILNIRSRIARTAKSEIQGTYLKRIYTFSGYIFWHKCSWQTLVCRLTFLFMHHRGLTVKMEECSWVFVSSSGITDFLAL